MKQCTIGVSTAGRPEMAVEREVGGLQGQKHLGGVT